MKALSISFITALRSSLSTMAVNQNDLQIKSVLQSLLHKQHTNGLVCKNLRSYFFKEILPCSQIIRAKALSPKQKKSGRKLTSMLISHMNYPFFLLLLSTYEFIVSLDFSKHGSVRQQQYNNRKSYMHKKSFLKQTNDRELRLFCAKFQSGDKSTTRFTTCTMAMSCCFVCECDCECHLLAPHLISQSGGVIEE